MSARRPSVRSVTVLPPVFGPVTTRAVNPSPSRTSIGTTRPVRPGWRADRRMTSERFGGLGARRVHLARELGLGGPEVELGEGAERLAQRPGVRADQRRQLVEDALDLRLLGGLRLAPRVAELDDDQRLDEQRLAAARRVVDDALDPALRLGPDRHHVAAVAERDDRLLEGVAELRGDERVEAAAEPIEGDADGGAQAAEAGRGRVEQLARRVERAGEGRADRRQRVELAAELALERPPRVGEVRFRARRRHRGWTRRRGTAAASRRPPRAARSIAGPMSRAPGDPDARPLLDERARLVGLVEAPRDEDRIRLRARAPRRDGGSGRTRCARPGARGRAGTRGSRWSGRPWSSGRRRAASFARGHGHGRAVRVDESPRPAAPRLRRRSRSRCAPSRLVRLAGRASLQPERPARVEEVAARVLAG